jgi:CRP/FNR family transcriptional regulator, cyclic AMP receptor protein
MSARTTTGKGLGGRRLARVAPAADAELLVTAIFLRLSIHAAKQKALQLNRVKPGVSRKPASWSLTLLALRNGNADTGRPRDTGTRMFSPLSRVARTHAGREPADGLPEKVLRGILHTFKRTNTLSCMEEPTLCDPLPVLTDDELVELEGVGHVIHRPHGSLLLGEGEETDFVLLIRKGAVRVVKGGSARVLSLRGSGDIIGEQAAVRRKPRSASVYAEGEVEAVYLSARAWREFLLSHPRAALAQLAVSYDRQEESDRKLVEASSLAVEQKLAKALAELHASGLGERTGEGVVLRFSQLDLASLIGASRDAVVPVIRALKAGGIVTTGRKMITIRDLGTLQQIARGERPVPADR